MTEELDTRGVPVERMMGEPGPVRVRRGRKWVELSPGEAWSRANAGRSGFEAGRVESGVSDEALAARDDRPAA